MKKIFTMIISSILIFGILTPLALEGTCEEINEKILYVGGSEDGNFSSIQDAINASSDGYTIFVFTETYNENILINKSIDLIGENKENTIIIGVKNKFDVITLNAMYVNITGFTIRDGPVSGIIIESSENCYIYQNTIDNNNIGIGILVSSNINIFDNTISNNSVTGLNVDCSLANEIPYAGFYSSIENTVYHNNFVNNTQHANDSCNTSWSHNNAGNYYDDYDYLDENNDGIGDEPYQIPGGDNVDKYPLMTPYDSETMQEFQVDEGILYRTLVIALVAAIIFVLPVGYIWYRKYHKTK